MDARLAVEAMRHQGYIQVFTPGGLLLQTRQDVENASSPDFVFKVTRRGKELLAKGSSSNAKKRSYP